MSIAEQVRDAEDDARMWLVDLQPKTIEEAAEKILAAKGSGVEVRQMGPGHPLISYDEGHGNLIICLPELPPNSRARAILHHIGLAGAFQPPYLSETITPE